MFNSAVKTESIAGNPRAYPLAAARKPPRQGCADDRRPLSND
jgi:hypothetical protein